MRIAIIGGGNIGTLMAVEFASRGHAVAMYASHPEQWSLHIESFDADDAPVCSGDLALATDDLRAAVDGADMVWVTYPTFMLESLAEHLLPMLEPRQWLGVVPGNDAEFIFAAHVARGGVLFGLQRVHSVARIKERGRSVYMLGRRTGGLHVAALPSAYTPQVAAAVEKLFDLPCECLPTYLAETLTPSNPILHTCRIFSMFHDWAPGVSYDRNFLFYEEWTDAASQLLIECDAELQSVCRELERRLGCDLSGVTSLLDHYQNSDAASMTAKITSIPGFKGLASPMREDGSGRWVPDFSSRYFKADFPYGMKAIKDIAGLVQVPVPRIGEVYAWYRRVSGDSVCFEGVPRSLDGLAALYV